MERATADHADLLGKMGFLVCHRKALVEIDFYVINFSVFQSDFHTASRLVDQVARDLNGLLARIIGVGDLDAFFPAGLEARLAGLSWLDVS